MSTDARPLLSFLPWLLASAAAHAVLLNAWPGHDQDNRAETVQLSALQVQLLRGTGRTIEAGTIRPAIQPVAEQQSVPASPHTSKPSHGIPERHRSAPVMHESSPTQAPTETTIASSDARLRVTRNDIPDTASKLNQTDAGSTELMALLHQAIDRNKRYPQSALRMGREGSARIDFRLGPDGRVEELNIGNSSGVHALDLAAYRAVRDIAPFPIAGRYLEHAQRFQVDVVFEIN